MSGEDRHPFFSGLFQVEHLRPDEVWQHEAGGWRRAAIVYRFVLDGGSAIRFPVILARGLLDKLACPTPARRRYVVQNDVHSILLRPSDTGDGLGDRGYKRSFLL
jgi:hypothetical protein